MLKRDDLVFCHQKVRVSLADEAHRYGSGDTSAEQIGRFFLRNDRGKTEMLGGYYFPQRSPPGQPNTLQLMDVGCDPDSGQLGSNQQRLPLFFSLTQLVIQCQQPFVEHLAGSILIKNRTLVQQRHDLFALSTDQADFKVEFTVDQLDQRRTGVDPGAIAGKDFRQPTGGTAGDLQIILCFQDPRRSKAIPKWDGPKHK